MIEVRSVPRVLIVDNDVRTGRDFGELLGPHGYQVHSADAEADDLVAVALDLASRIRPHVIITDLRLLDDDSLDDCSGLAFLAHPAIASAQRILYSAYLQNDYTIPLKAIQSGIAHAVVGKAQDPKTMIDAVRDAAGRLGAIGNSRRVEWPEGWDETALVRALFDTDDVPAHLVTDVLFQLFPRARSLALAALDGSAAAPLPIAAGHVLRATPDGWGPSVVKLAPAERIRRESSAYRRHVEAQLGGNFHPQMHGDVAFWEMGAIRYTLLGSSRPASTLATFYRTHEDPADVVRPLRHFFGEVWRRHYTTALEESGTLFATCDRMFQLGDCLKAMLTTHPAELEYTELDCRFAHPARWVVDNLAEFDRVVPLCVSHGDCHAGNLLTDGDHGWPIDFERTGPAPVIIDYVELEQDLLTRLAGLPDDDWSGFHELARRVTAPATLDESLIDTSDGGSPAEHLSKTLSVVEAIRRSAHEVAAPVSAKDYYWGLLLHAVWRSARAGDDAIRARRHLLLAAVLCERLERWKAAPASV